MANFRSCSNVKYEQRGAGDPSIVWNGLEFNYWDVEEALWQSFLDAVRSGDVALRGLDAEQAAALADLDPDAVARDHDDEFTAYCDDDEVIPYLEDVVTEGYFRHGHRSWKDSVGLSFTDDERLAFDDAQGVRETLENLSDAPLLALIVGADSSDETCASMAGSPEARVIRHALRSGLFEGLGGGTIESFAEKHPDDWYKLLHRYVSEYAPAAALLLSGMVGRLSTEQAMSEAVDEAKAALAEAREMSGLSISTSDIEEL